jgi:hypothetical protein
MGFASCCGCRCLWAFDGGSLELREALGVIGVVGEVSNGFRPGDCLKGAKAGGALDGFTPKGGILQAGPCA